MIPREIIATVLVADDEPGVRKSLSASLSRAGFEVTTVDDGAPAIALAESGAFDIVVVDLHMATSGLAVVRQYKGRYGSRVYCAVLSGEDDEATRKSCIEAGADEVFVKPIMPLVLRNRLTAAVQVLRAAVASA